MISQRIEIELWEDARGNVPVAEFLSKLPKEHQARIVKRNDFFENLTWEQLGQSRYYEKVQGIQYPLWELKYPGSGSFSYRMLCFRWKELLIGVEMFAGSGSSGNVLNYVPVAIRRADDWKFRYP